MRVGSLTPGSLHAAQRHRPGHRAAQHLDLEAALQEALEAALRPVVEVPRRVAAAAQVLDPRHVQPPPQRLARERSRSARASPGPPGCRAPPRGPRGAPAPRSRRPARPSPGPGRAPARGFASNSISSPSAAARAPRLGDHLGEGVAAPDAQALARHQPRQLALAAADLVGLGGAAELDHGAELAQEAVDQPALDRVRRGVLVVDVAAGLLGVDVGDFADARRPPGAPLTSG